MVKIFGAIFRFVTNFVYSFFKLKKTKNQVAFISRQSETPSIDFKYLINELKAQYPQYDIVVLCKMIPSGLGGKIKYIGEMFRQMNALAQSKVVVLDGYCILASVLKHKKDLKIIQIWHALGAFKRFGRSILDKEGGKSSALADAMRMHKNYDLIAVSGEKCVPAFSEAFGQPADKFIPIGIPRMDYLTDDEMNKSIKSKVLAAYPSLGNGKRNILYVPTFRDNDEDIQNLRAHTEELASRVNYDDFNLIVKHHVVDTNKEEIYTSSHLNEQSGELFTGMDFMSVADAVITDYSSVIYEALLKNIPVYIFDFDGDKYIDERGFYIDFKNDIPAIFGETAFEICKRIENGDTADAEKINTFKNDYVNKRFDSITSVYGEIIDSLIKGTYDGKYNYKG